MKKLSVLVMFLIISTANIFARVSISSFNIQWYGLGGVMTGEARDEFRNPWLSEFLDLRVLNSDILVFQEIVDVKMLESFLGDKFSCISYDHEREKHQYVVICTTNKFKLNIESGDDDYIIDESALIKYRPAVYALVSDQSGKNLFHIVGVHLKALENSSEKRIEQVKIINTRLSEFKDDLPIIFIGDFNTHGDDVLKFNEILKGFGHIENDLLTYNTGYYKATLDHVWIKGDIQESSLKVLGPCNLKREEQGERMLSTSFFNRFISDHCLIELVLNF